jgi:hypothetical protein
MTRRGLAGSSTAAGAGISTGTCCDVPAFFRINLRLRATPDFARDRLADVERRREHACPGDLGSPLVGSENVVSAGGITATSTWAR